MARVLWEKKVNETTHTNAHAEAVSVGLVNEVIPLRHISGSAGLV